MRRLEKSGGDGMLLDSGTAEPEPGPIAWRGPLALALVACLPLLIATSMVVVPSGMGGVRISQIGGTEPGTLYPGLHFVTPLVESVQMFDLRDHLFTAGVVDARQAGPEERADCAVARGAEHRTGGDGALPARSEQARERAGASAAAGGQGTGASGRGERVARTGAVVHGARNLLEQARGGAERGGRHHHDASWQPTASWWKK